MMKKIASLLLTVVLLAAMLTVFAVPASAEETYAAQGLCGSDGEVHWGLSKDYETLTIWGNGNMKNYAKDEAPWYEYNAYNTVKHLKVGIKETDNITRIGSYAFAYFYYLETIELGDDIEMIEDYAFYYAGYYTENAKIDLVIPSTVFYIGQYAFSKTFGLKNVYIKSDYAAIRAFAKNNSFPTVQGKNVTGKEIYIEKGAFYDCENMETLAIGSFKKSENKNVHIGIYAFDYCYKLRTIYFSDSLASISEDSFYDCTVLETVYYFGEQDNFPRDQVSGKNNPRLDRAVNYRICMPYIDTYKHDANYHWINNTAGIPLYYDEGKKPHNFIEAVDDKYKVEGSYVRYYKSCAVCGRADSETFSTSYFDIPGIIRLTTETTTLDTGWYIVDSQLDFGSTRLQINGDVKITLLDGCGITTSGGIHVKNHTKLTVCSDSIDLSENNNMGYIKVTGAPDESAGIGSDSEDETDLKTGVLAVLDLYRGAGEVIICGGNVDVRGGYNGAGIGSGDMAGLFVTINNGRVIAHGGFDGAGIGSGNCAVSYVTINDGYVEAHGGYEAAGIGCGGTTFDIGGSAVYIKGGTVKAWGGNGSYAIGNSKTNHKCSVSYSGNAKVEAYDDKNAWMFASVLSEGYIWIVIAVAVVALGGVAALIIVKKKKKKPALAGGADKTDGE